MARSYLSRFRDWVSSTPATNDVELVTPVVGDGGLDGPVEASSNTSRFNGRGDLTHPGYRYERHDGEKFEGGLGPIELLLTDYWSLRRRSVTFFKRNPYGRGIIRRILTNVVNTGLTLSAAPIERFIPLEGDALEEWTDNVNELFKAWGSTPETCTFNKALTFGQFQKAAKREALISGDVLVIEHHDSKTNTPTYELIDGQLVQTPHEAQSRIAAGNTIDNGVEMNPAGEHVRYWVLQENFTFKGIRARGANGRLMAWLYYGTDKRHNEARGEPLLTLVMQNISEIDKYRDSTQRKATTGSQLVAFIFSQTGSGTMATSPFTAGSRRHVTGERFEGDGTVSRTNIAEHNPGLVIENLPDGKEVKAFPSDTTDEKFGEFEKAIISGIAWALNMPVSVLMMQFDSSYSASRGEIKEYESVLMEMRDTDADALLRPIYRSWLRTMVLTRRIEAPGLIAAARTPALFEVYAAWVYSEWYGIVKEAVDLPKEVLGRKGQIDMGALTYAKAARMLTGTDFKTNVGKIKREQQLLADALRPMLELRREFGEADTTEALSALALREVS